MKKQRKRLATTIAGNRVYDIRSVNEVSEYKDYRTDHLNWRDDGDELTDPAMNDFLKGYNIDPYEFKQWASIKYNKQFKTAMNKTAASEVFIMKFSPEFLADRILTLWNGVDGPLQNFFEAFTIRYNNNLKRQIANQLAKQGYQVYPVLVDDKPRYAALTKVMKKVAKSKDIDTILHFATTINKSDHLQLFANELKDLRDYHSPVSTKEALGLLKYYEHCFPKEYAFRLVHGLMANASVPRNIDFKRFEDSDWDISNESLQKIEDYMSGNAKTYVRDGGTNGWNFVTDMRNFDGTAPGRYEITAKKRLKKNKQ